MICITACCLIFFSNCKKNGQKSFSQRKSDMGVNMRIKKAGLFFSALPKKL
jgi:hypothetical protein